MELTRKHCRCRITHTHHQNTQAEPSVRRKFRFRALATKVDPCHDEFTRKHCRCRIMHTHHQSTRQEPTLQRRWRYEAPAATELTPSRRATSFHHLAQPLATSIIYHNTRHKQESRRRPHIQGYRPTLQHRRTETGGGYRQRPPILKNDTVRKRNRQRPPTL